MFDKLVRLIKQLFNSLLDGLFLDRRRPAGILAETESALREWKHAKKLLHHADKEMIDYAIHHMNASEKKYVGLLQKAREAGIRAWEFDCENVNLSHGQVCTEETNSWS